MNNTFWLKIVVFILYFLEFQVFYFILFFRKQNLKHKHATTCYNYIAIKSIWINKETWEKTLACTGAVLLVTVQQDKDLPYRLAIEAVTSTSGKSLLERTRPDLSMNLGVLCRWETVAYYIEIKFCSREAQERGRREKIVVMCLTAEGRDSIYSLQSFRRL